MRDTLGERFKAGNRRLVSLAMVRALQHSAARLAHRQVWRVKMSLLYVFLIAYFVPILSGETKAQISRRARNAVDRAAARLPEPEARSRGEEWKDEIRDRRDEPVAACFYAIGRLHDAEVACKSQAVAEGRIGEMSSVRRLAVIGSVLLGGLALWSLFGGLIYVAYRFIPWSSFIPLGAVVRIIGTILDSAEDVARAVALLASTPDVQLGAQVAGGLMLIGFLVGCVAGLRYLRQTSRLTEATGGAPRALPPGV